MDISLLMKQARRTLVKHAPHILTSAGVVGTVSTVVLAVRATPQAYETLAAEQCKKGMDDALTKREIVKHTWRYYIPTAMLGTATIACIIGANTIQTRRIAAVAAAYSLAEKASGTLQEKMVEMFGEEAVHQAKSDILQDYLAEDPIEKNPPVPGPAGDNLFYDSLSGRYFHANIVDLERVVSKLNFELVNDTWVSLNELYMRINLEPIVLGESLGWNSDNLIEIDFATKLATDGRPCIVLNYIVEPKLDYYRHI